MYKIIGGDQKQYGPVSADEVRLWIADGRLNAQSLAWAEGTTDWKPLGSFPEFADALQIKTAPQFPGPASLPPGTTQDFAAEIVSRPPQVQIGQCLERSWVLWKRNFGLIFGGCLLYGLLSLCQLVPGVGMIYFVFKGVFQGGLLLIFLSCIRAQPAAVGDVFSGFRISFAQLLLAGLVRGLLTFLGLCCCVLPGLYLFIAWTFAVPLVIDKKLEFWSALELSRKVVTRVWFEIFGLTLIAFLPFLIGLALLSVFGGVRSSDTAHAIEQVLSSGQPDMGELVKLLWTIAMQNLLVNFLAKAILILNLPFAYGALMYAYEDLFGARRAPSP